MSADNSIIVLCTLNDKDFEFRVEELSASEDLFWHLDPEDHSPNWPFINTVFNGSTVFKSYAAAMERAAALERECQILEYGISVVEIDEPFKALPDSEARRLMEAEREAANQQARAEQREHEQRRLDSQVELSAEEAFEATAIYGYLVHKDGSRTHGSIVLQGLEKPFTVDPTKIGLKLKFQPSDW